MVEYKSFWKDFSTVKRYFLSKTVKCWLVERRGWGLGSRWQCRKVLSSHPPMHTIIYNYMQNNSHWRGFRYWISRVWVTKESTETCKRNKNTVLLRKNLHSGMELHGLEGSQRYRTFPWGARDSNFTSGTLTLRYCTGETSPQNTWLWKPTGNMSRKKYRTVGKGKPVLSRDSAQTHLTQKAVQKQHFEKHIDLRQRRPTS